MLTPVGRRVMPGRVAGGPGILSMSFPLKIVAIVGIATVSVAAAEAETGDSATTTRSPHRTPVVQLVNIRGSIYTPRKQKDWGRGKQLGLELAEDIRLMQDLGWGENESIADDAAARPPGSPQSPGLRGEAEIALACANPRPEDAETNEPLRDAGRGRRSADFG